jgi:group I intron endonuclease
MLTGIIYTATNTSDGKVYVGQTSKPLKTRRAEHEKDALDGGSVYFHLALMAHGFEVFDWCEVERTERETKEELKKALNEFERGRIMSMAISGVELYNLTDGGEGALGCKRGEETRAKISVARKGKHLSIEHRAKLSASHREAYKDPEYHAKLSRAMSNYFATHEVHPSEESRAKMSASHAGKRPNIETRTKISDALREKPFSEEHRAKINASISRSAYGCFCKRDRWKEEKVAKQKRLSMNLGQRLEVEYAVIPETEKFSADVEVKRVYAYSGAVRVEVTPLLRHNSPDMMIKISDQCLKAEGLSAGIPF